MSHQEVRIEQTNYDMNPPNNHYEENVRSQDDLVFTTEVDTDFPKKKAPVESQYTERVASTRMSDGMSAPNQNHSQSMLNINASEEIAFRDVIKELVTKD
jgi:hypothetical protein